MTSNNITFIHPEARVMGSWSQETPTMYLRYIYKDGQYVLQQLWEIKDANMKRLDYKTEWRDVPVADETQP